MRIAITGASGFVGGHFASRLAAEGHEVFTYGRRPKSAVHPSLPNYSAWDLNDGPIGAPDVHAIVHCAALVGDWGSERAYRRVNVDGTRTVLEVFARTPLFIHISSTSVYSDDVHKQRVSENAPIGECRFSPYARTKAEAERLILQNRPDAIVLRPHIVYGYGDRTILPRILAARRFGALLVPGTGKNLVSVTHVDNLASAIHCSLQQPISSGTFNISDGEDVSVDELLATIFARIDRSTTLVHVPRAAALSVARALESVWPSRRPPRGPLLTRYAVAQLADEHTVDISRARKQLGYVPRWTFRDGPL